MRRRKTRVLHYGTLPIIYSSPSFYKFIWYITSSNNTRHFSHYYPEIFDVEYFTWTKRAVYKIDVKKVYLLDFFELVLTLIKKSIDKDIIVTLGFPAILEFIVLMFISKIRGIRIFVRDTHWYWPQTRISRFLWNIYFKLLKHVDGILCPGLASYNYWKTYGFKKVYIVHYYALEATTTECNLDREEIRRRLGIGDDEIVILYLGRLVKKKGLDVLILAFLKLVSEKPTFNIKLTIAGDGPERKRLENLCNQLGLAGKVVFLGAVPEKIKKCIYKASDIFVYTPIIMEIPEEWPIAPLEAMSLGIPTIVSTAVGSLPDISHGVLVVRHGDAEALYRAMKCLLENKRLQSYLSKLSLNIYTNLSNLTRIKMEFLYAMLNSFRNLYR